MATREKLIDRAARSGEAIMQLEEGLQIDQHDLDNALVGQPDMFYRVSKQLTLLVSRRDAKKQELAEEEAKADAEIRRTASKMQEKLTEAEVKNLIRLDKDVQRVANEHLDLNRQVGELTALKEAYQQRSYVLKDLVNLYIANYYQSNADGSGSSRLKDHRAQTAREGMHAERSRRNERD